ncbi:Periostin [Rhypophila decipiens]|uniref:Periostin n=1 Tax=Rhypophila decipiens TaxID=261697 RepID=A0AAN6Y2D9_9PEZI|nr:Periostin [Rhypophila decipiens]
MAEPTTTDYIITGIPADQLFLFLFIFTIGSSAQSLLDVLRKEGFTRWAAVLESPQNAGVLGYPHNLIIYTPTNAAIARQQLSGGVNRRQVSDADILAAFLAVPESGNDGLYKRSNPTCNPDIAGPGTEDLMTLLNDPEFVNLPLGQNASIVQKNMPKGTLPIVLTGLGDTVRVIAEDIPFDKGVIRPISGWFTLPQLLSETLPFLGADKVLGVLERTGLIDDFDNRTGITFLAPEDPAFPSNLADDVLADILRRHLIVGLPTFTSDINHGDTFRTLAGTTVTVTITCGEVSIGGARILSGDTIIKNGVVHIIDSVSNRHGTVVCKCRMLTGPY